jgi:hypothetical protein
VRQHLRLWSRYPDPLEGGGHSGVILPCLGRGGEPAALPRKILMGKDLIIEPQRDQVIFFPLSLTLSLIRGEGIEKEPI